MKGNKGYSYFLLIFFLFEINRLYGQCLTCTLGDVRYRGRYVDAVNQKFYDSDFYVTMNVHESLNSEFGVSVSNIQNWANEWNNVGSFFHFDIANLPVNGDILYNEMFEEPPQPQFNVIGADNPIIEFAEEFNQCYFGTVGCPMDLAYTQWSYTTTDCDGWYKPVILGADIIINSQPGAGIKLIDENDPSCGDFTQQNIQLKRVVLHEMGHVTGIRHHPNSTNNDILHPSEKPGYCSSSYLSDLDRFALKRLYGINPADGNPYDGGDDGQFSSIPCSVFVQTPIEKLFSEPLESDGTPPQPASGCEKSDIRLLLNGYPVESGAPCIDLPIVLKPYAYNPCPDPKWFFSYTYSNNEWCSDVTTPSLCNSPLGINCDCKYFEYWINIREDDNQGNLGPVYEKKFIEQVQFVDQDNDFPPDYNSHTAPIIIDQAKISEIGISLSPGKQYRIIVKGHMPNTSNPWMPSGSSSYERWFRLNLHDISYSNTNLISSPPSFTTNTFSNFLVFIQTNTFVHNPLGTNIYLDNVTTTNYISPIMDMTVTASNINISATNSISISNSVISSGFVAAIVDAPGCMQGRMANPDDDKITKPGANNYLNESYVYYNSKQIAAERDNSTVIDDIENTEKQKSEPSLLLIPNPSSSGVFNFSQNFSEFNNYDLTIYNLLGEKVFNSIQPNLQNLIDISSNPKGIYFVEIRNGEEMSVQKIVYQ